MIGCRFFSDFTDFVILITSLWEFIIWLLFGELLGIENIDNVIKAVVSFCIYFIKYKTLFGQKPY